MELNGKTCTSCGFLMLDPGFCCPNCGSDHLENYKFDGNGKIHTYTVVMVGFGHLANRVPYVLSIVELKEGLKILTIIEDIDIEKVKIDQSVKYKRYEEQTGPIFMPA
ncbi:MAG: OB-fold domain-containing protein [Leptospiraceae bacterium]|nr:OB-fold domain-containing protein [Leptospiraceae bacterium]MCP5511981.1 OB-fold domain-containing protein [Leptospiraceae bacterium]